MTERNEPGAAGPTLEAPWWLRWGALLPAGIVYLAGVAVAAAWLGGWGVVLGFGGLLAATAWVVARASRREARARARHLTARGRVPVAEQAAALLRDRGVGVTQARVGAIVRSWCEAAWILSVDPEYLRAGDDLMRDYRPVISPLTDDSAVQRLVWEAERAGGAVAHGVPTAAAARPCRFCGYDLSGSPEGAVCPECGKDPGTLRTLGDYVLFLARGEMPADWRAGAGAGGGGGAV